MSNNNSKPETIKAYIAEQNEDLQDILLKVHEVIRSAAPNCVEKMSWQMPTYWQGENLIHFCVHKKHLGIYPGLVENIPFQDRLKAVIESKERTLESIKDKLCNTQEGYNMENTFSEIKLFSS